MNEALKGEAERPITNPATCLAETGPMDDWLSYLTTQGSKKIHTMEEAWRMTTR